MARSGDSYHHGDLREALVAAGLKLLREEGPAALTLRACARQAGVSHAAPRHHFATVEALLAEIAARGFEAFVAALAVDSERETTPGDRLAAMCRAYVQFALDDPAVYGLMFRQGAAGLASEHLRTAAGKAWLQLEEAVPAIAGAPGTVPPGAGFVWSAVHGLATLLIDRRFPVDVDREHLVAAVVAGVIRGLGR